MPTLNALVSTHRRAALRCAALRSQASSSFGPFLQAMRSARSG